ncbi:MAG: DNA-binding protein [Rhodanobacteraceae bacterium]|nr:MAG: DNA-binding protein [Rhodanobacteraceae bacterium]
MTTEEMILSRYGGPLLTYEQVAELLHRSPGGLRITLCRRGELPDRLRECRVRIGRRVLFRVSGLVHIVDAAAAA